MITSTPAFQGDYTAVPPTIILILPHELLERILLLLDTKSILICKLVNRELNEIIQSSTLLQYFLACKAAGVIDNPRSPLSYGERLEALLKREEAWRTLNPVFKATIKINRRPSPVQFFCLTGGTFFLEDSNRKDLNYCHLPSSPQDNLQWNRIPGYGPGEGSPRICDITVYEHDLIANIIYSDMGNQADTQRYSLDLVLLKFSTGEYHPLACHPRIHVQRSPEAQPLIKLTIIGDNLALIVQSRDWTSSDRLFIFDWKSGYKRLQHNATICAYSDLVFVSPEILLVPNIRRAGFEVWHVPPSHLNRKPPVQILTLKIPVISRIDYSLSNASCNRELNPSLHSMTYFPPRPFFPSPEDSIISTNFWFHSLWGTYVESFTLIVLRRALLDTIQTWSSHKIADPDHGSSSISSGSSTTQSTVRWADWGPPISRWFQVSEDRWTMRSASTSQRYAFLGPNRLDGSKPKISVADFNPHSFKRNTDMTARPRREGKSRGANGDNEKEQVDEEEMEKFEHRSVFLEEVHMGLKCVIYHLPDEYDFDAVLMDEERLLGLKLNRYDYVESIKVLYFG